MLNLIGLLNLNADADAVDTRLDEHTLVLVAGNCKGVQQHFWRCLRFDFWDIVPLRRLGCEVR